MYTVVYRWLISTLFLLAIQLQGHYLYNYPVTINVLQYVYLMFEVINCNLCHFITKVDHKQLSSFEQINVSGTSWLQSGVIFNKTCKFQTSQERFGGKMWNSALEYCVDLSRLYTIKEFNIPDSVHFFVIIVLVRVVGRLFEGKLAYTETLTVQLIRIKQCSIGYTHFTYHILKRR